MSLDNIPDILQIIYIRHASIVPEFVRSMFRHFSQLFDYDGWSMKWDE